MRRLAFALIVFALATPAWAAPSWTSVSLGGSGLTTHTTRAFTFDSSTFALWDPASTTRTNAIRLCKRSGTTWSCSSLTPSAPSSAYGTLTALGGSIANDELFFCGGVIASNRWCQYTSISSPGSYTSIVDGGASDSYLGNIVPVAGTTYRYVLGYKSGNNLYVSNWNQPTNNSSTLTVPIDCWRGPSGYADDYIGAYTGSVYHFHAATKSGNSCFIGWNGISGSAAYTNNDIYDCNFNGSMRKAFGYLGGGTDPIIVLTDRCSGGTTYVLQGRGATGSAKFDSTRSGDPRPLGEWNPSGSLDRSWWALTTGETYVTNGDPGSSFGANATYNITSGLLTGGKTVVVGVDGVDTDNDGATVDNILVLLSDGNAVAYGEEVAASPRRRKESWMVNQPLRQVIP